VCDVVVVIPARYGSTRLPGKPLLDLEGAPILARVLEQLHALAPIPLLVATDHEQIARVAREYGALPLMTPPDCPTGLDRVAAAVASRSEDIVVNVQGDEPFVDPAAVKKLISTMREAPDLPMATLAAPVSDLESYRSPDCVKVVLSAGSRALYFSRHPIPWSDSDTGVPHGALKHLGVYAYRKATLRALAEQGPARIERQERLEQLRALHLGVPIQVLRVDRAWIGVDTPRDLERARRHWRIRHPTAEGAA